MPGTPPGRPADGPRSQTGEAGRERLIGLLREHYAQGRLDDDELSRRVGVVLAAEFADEAAAVVGDLPSLVPAGPARPAGRRGHAQAVAPGPAWVPTSELFRDPTTNVVMRVWIDPADQSRHYVPESDG